MYIVQCYSPPGPLCSHKEVHVCTGTGGEERVERRGDGKGGEGRERREEGGKEKEVHCICDRSKGEQWKDGLACTYVYTCTYVHVPCHKIRLGDFQWQQ